MYQHCFPCLVPNSVLIDKVDVSPVLVYISHKNNLEIRFAIISKVQNDGHLPSN